MLGRPNPEFSLKSDVLSPPSPLKAGRMSQNTRFYLLTQLAANSALTDMASLSLRDQALPKSMLALPLSVRQIAFINLLSRRRASFADSS
jgi:hypothetical protein